MEKAKGKVLIVDDDEFVRLSLKVLLEDHYAIVDCIEKPELINDYQQSTLYDVILLDMNYKPGDTTGRDGIKWLKIIKENSPDISVVIVTAYSDLNLAVEALKAGAVDFVVKPWQNEKILATVNAAYQLNQSKSIIGKLDQRQKALGRISGLPFEEMVGTSPLMRRIYETIEKVAPTDANVLILGENGTGKELVARAIHKLSSRRSGVFISVDAGAIPESLFESELFGHKKGAFTDAQEDRIGRFEAATGGSIFLDEIGNIPLNLQAKLLSVLQNRQLSRLGSNKMVDIDVRLICATNADIKQNINEGKFRQDLFYRINTVEIVMPPLRDRIEDIPLLINYFTEFYCKKYNRSRLKVNPAVTQRLQKYDWPGNVRELKHMIERAVILSSSGHIELADLFITEALKNQEYPFKDFNLDHIEKWAITECMKKYNGNVSKTADELGLTRGALYRRFEKYGL